MKPLFIVDQATNPIRIKPYAEKWEGLRVQTPLYIDGKNGIWWTVEHHLSQSLGAYEVKRGGEYATFHRLCDAVDWYNREGNYGKKENKSKQDSEDSSRC